MPNKKCNRCKVEKDVETGFYHQKLSGKPFNPCRACRCVERAKHAKASRARPAKPLTEKRCGDCHKTKPIIGFSHNRSTASGWASTCKSCLTRRTREWKLQPGVREHWRRYMMDWKANAQAGPEAVGYEEYQVLLAAQLGRCRICHTDDPKPKTRFSVDHDHATGRVRGLLCLYCNLSLGRFHEDPALILKSAKAFRGHPRAAVEYLVSAALVEVSL